MGRIREKKRIRTIIFVIIAMVMSAGTSLLTAQTVVAFDDDKGADDYIRFAKIDENGELINGAKFKFYGSDGKGVREGIDTIRIEKEVKQNTWGRPPSEFYGFTDINLQACCQFFGVELPDGSFDGAAQFRDLDAYIIMEEIDTPDKYAPAPPVTISYAGSDTPNMPYSNYSLKITGEAKSEVIKSLSPYYRFAQCLSEDPGKEAEKAYKVKYAHNNKNWPDFLIVNYPKVKIAKKDTNGMYLKGATLEITGTTSKGHAIKKKTIVSTKEAMILGLPSGTYTLHEVEAPEGYENAADIEFTVTGDVINVNGETVDEVVMTDKKEYEPKPLLNVRKTSSIKTAKPGDVIPYVITVTNKGDADADEVIVLDTMGENLIYVSDDSNGVVDGQKVSWNVIVPAGESREIRIACRIDKSAAGKVINDVRITNIVEEFVEPEAAEDQVEIVLGESEDKVSEEKHTKEPDEPDKTKRPGEPEEPDKLNKHADTGDGVNMLVLFILLITACVTIGALACRRIAGE